MRVLGNTNIPGGSELALMSDCSRLRTMSKSENMHCNKIIQSEVFKISVFQTYTGYESGWVYLDLETCEIGEFIHSASFYWTRVSKTGL